MSDFERYGDYNEIDEAPGKSPIGIFIKVVAASLCIFVIAMLLFRVVIFNTYPDSMKRLLFNDSLTEYYNSVDGDIEVYTQSLRIQYDDPDEGNFFCDNLFVIPEIDQLQVSLRYNESLFDNIKTQYGVELPVDDISIFSFRLWTSGESEAEADHLTGTLSVAAPDNRYMYRYIKLVFDDVRLDFDSDLPTEWIRLEIFIDGVEREQPYMVLIYENNEDYSSFEEYELHRSEAP